MKQYLFKLLLVMSCYMSGNVAYGHDFEATYNGKTIYYKITSSTDKTVGVSYRGNEYYEFDNEYSGTVNIPKTVSYNGTTYSVTSIGDIAFYRCFRLTSIEIPNSVRSIGNDAFYNCSGLKSIEIPNSITSIGDRAFSGCSGLTEIHWTPNADTNLSSALNNALLTSASRTLYLYKDAQNSDMVNSLVSSLDGQFKEIIVVEDYDSYDLTVTNAGMSTLYLDYPVSVPDDVNMLGVFYVFEIDGNILKLKRLDDFIPANNGVIIMANAGTFTFNGTGEEVDEITDNQLRGVTENTPVSSIDGTVYTLGRGINSGYFGFHKYTGANIPANKAFLVRNASSGVNSFNLVLDNEDGTSTAIGRIENGELIPESNVIYDLQGRRVENPSKGIYIVNGKKQYIK